MEVEVMSALEASRETPHFCSCLLSQSPAPCPVVFVFTYNSFNKGFGQ